MQTYVNRRNWYARCALGLLFGADLAALVLLRSCAGRAARRIPHLGEWVLRAGCDRVLERLVATAVWLAAAWLALGLLAALAAALPGIPGRISAALCRAMLPGAVRRLVAGSAGLGVLLAPAAALATPATSSAGPIVNAARHSPGAPLPPPTWPSSRHASSPRTRHESRQPPTQPVSRRPAPDPPRTQAPRHPSQPASEPAAPKQPPTGHTVRVRPGECLWLLAARHLPPTASAAEIAAYWPRWYAANRQVIGSDPDLVQPGEVLHVPPPPPAAQR